MSVKTLDELVNSLSANEKALFEKVLKENSEIKDGWLRQDDYSRKQNELKAKETEYQEAVSYKARVEPWANQAYEIMHDMEEAGALKLVDGGEKDAPKYEVSWTAQKQELERQLEEAKKNLGGDMDAAELEKRVQAIVKANGGVTPDEMKALVIAEGKKLAEEVVNARFVTEEKNFNEKTIPYVAGFSAGVAVVANRYEKETGKPWTNDTAKELYTLMGKEQNFDPLLMGDKMLEPIKQEKERKAEVERLANEKFEEFKKNFKGMPGSGSEDFVPQQMGHLQRMVQESQADGNGDFEAMIKSHAVKAAVELQKEGKA